MDKRKVLPALAVLAAVALPALVVWLYKDWHAPKYRIEQGIENDTSGVLPDSEEVSAHFEVSAESFQKNGKYNISLVLDEEAPLALAAVSLRINFDPKLIKITEVKTGDIFASVNLLQSEIDNEKGEVLLSFGKGFEVGEAAGKIVAVLDFTFLGRQEDVALITLGSESSGSFIGKEEAQSFFAPSFFLNSKGDTPTDFLNEGDF